MNFNRQDISALSASAQEFVPKNVPSQLNEWHHQNVHQNVGPAESTGYMYAANAPIRQFVPNQQYQIASSLQRPPQHIFQQHPRQHQSYHQPQPMHQRHFQQPQQYMMNNSRQVSFQILNIVYALKSPYFFRSLTNTEVPQMSTIGLIIVPMGITTT